MIKDFDYDTPTLSIKFYELLEAAKIVYDYKIIMPQSKNISIIKIRKFDM